MSKLRLDKILSHMGYLSRSEVKKACKQGLISVNNKIVKDYGLQVDTTKDEIILNGEKVVYKEFIYIMLNKPDGYLSATYDKKDKIVLDLIDKKYLILDGT